MSKRLKKILSAIPKCGVLCDVGCDHGYVGIGAFERGLADETVFVDISADCLQKARVNCPEALKSKARFVCRNGIGDIRCDTAVIAGMGGLEIISILKGAETLPEFLVLQPMRNQYDVRAYLQERYEILSDVKFFDGKFYDLIVGRLSSSPSKLSEEEMIFGKSNVASPTEDYVKYLYKEHDKLSEILRGCDNSEIREKLRVLEKAIANALK